MVFVFHVSLRIHSLHALDEDEGRVIQYARPVILLEGGFTLGRQTRTLPVNLLKPCGMQGFLVNRNVEVVILNGEGVVFQVKGSFDRRSFLPLPHDARFKPVFAIRRCIGEVQGRIAINCDETATRFQTTSDPIAHSPQFIPVLSVVQQISGHDEIIPIGQSQMPSIPHQEINSLEIF